MRLIAPPSWSLTIRVEDRAGGNGRSPSAAASRRGGSW
jgi:hypothetical protein